MLDRNETTKKSLVFDDFGHFAGFCPRDENRSVAQHECDHLIGRLYPSRITDFSKFGYTEVLFPGMDPADE